MGTCAGIRCIERYIEFIWIGPNNEDFCHLCAISSWQTYKNKLRKDLGLEPVAKVGVPDFIAKRKTGVMIIYPGSYDKPVRSIWTPTRCYPYPNWRNKFGLKKSYLTEECRIQEAVQ